MFGSFITHPLRIATQPLRLATRGALITLHGAQEAVEFAEGLVGLLVGKLLGQTDQRGDAAAEPPAWQGPAASSASSPNDRPPPSADRPPRSTGRAEPATTAPPADLPAPAAEEPPPGPVTAPPPADLTVPAAEAPEPAIPDAEQVEQSLFPEAGHVSEEIELVEEFADPGAEEGAGAQLRIAEPWRGYRTMKAADIIDRIASSTREELAAVELFEMSARNRKSVVAAAQRALKQSSPPR
jgi:hypothetical protein